MTTLTVCLAIFISTYIITWYLLYTRMGVFASALRLSRSKYLTLVIIGNVITLSIGLAIIFASDVFAIVIATLSVVGVIQQIVWSAQLPTDKQINANRHSALSGFNE